MPLFLQERLQGVFRRPKAALHIVDAKTGQDSVACLSCGLLIRSSVSIGNVSRHKQLIRKPRLESLNFFSISID